MRITRLAAGALLLAGTFACQAGERSLLSPTDQARPRVQRVGHSKPLTARQGPAGLSLALSAPVGGIAVQDMTQGVTALQMAQALVGPGVAISNVTYTGAPAAGALFASDSSVIGMKNGIILSTGTAAGVIGPNLLDDMTTDWGLPGDANLSTLVGGNPTFDASVLEFDFVPDSSTIYIAAYVFGSEEYDTFVGSDYNDAMAFYVNGTNCALIGGQPVSINAINNGYPYGTPPFSNPDLYRDNSAATGKTINTELNGLTRTLQCAASVNKGVTNHLKLAIADTYDGLYDSDVFIGGGALTTIPPVPIPMPHAVATYSTAVHCGGTPDWIVTFDGSGSNETGAGTITTYQWFYGASLATGQLYGTGVTMTHEFGAGTTGFPMGLQVTDSHGNTASTTFTVSVPAIGAPVDSFSVSPITFTAATGQYQKMTVKAKSVGACPDLLTVTARSSQGDSVNAVGDKGGDIRIAHNDGSVTLSSNAQPIVTFNPATDTLYLRAETLDSVTNRTYSLVMSANGTPKDSVQVLVPHPIPAGSAAWVIFANSTLRMVGNAGTDGYNSSKSQYNRYAHDSTGNVAAIGPITFTGNALVQGDATSASTITPGPFVTGHEIQYSHALQAFQVKACPAGAYSPASVLSGNKFSYNANTGALSVSGNGSVVLNGAGPFYFSSISLSGNATMQTTNPGSQHVDLYVSDQLSSSGNGITNALQRAGALAIIACGSPSKPSDWSITGNGSSYMTIYAPNHDIHIAGNGDLFGCVVGDDITLDGNAKIHADEALAGACGIGNTSGIGGSGSGGNNGSGSGSNCDNGSGKGKGDDDHSGGDGSKGGSGGDGHHG